VVTLPTIDGNLVRFCHLDGNIVSPIIFFFFGHHTEPPPFFGGLGVFLGATIASTVGTEEELVHRMNEVAKYNTNFTQIFQRY